jgi:hypothetical protein
LVHEIVLQSSSDLPLLVSVKNLANRLLEGLLPDSSSHVSSNPANPQFRIGFITPPFKDSKIPITDHLHAHAYILPSDLMGWWRSMGYGALAWYAIDDLIAEIRYASLLLILLSFTLTCPLIRESVSNNRVKSGYENRPLAPIDMVPQAGARAGTADGTETSEIGLAHPDLQEVEEGEGTPSTPAPQSPAISQSPIPSLQV